MNVYRKVVKTMMLQICLRLAVIVLGCIGVYNLQAGPATVEIAQNETKVVRLYVHTIKNSSKATFEIYYSSGAKGLLLPDSVLEFKPYELSLEQAVPLQIKCVKGPYVDMYLQDGGKVSGTAYAGYAGPYALAMWLSYPQVSVKEKTFIPYVVAEHKQGGITLCIDEKGSLQIQAVYDIKLISSSAS